jgi:hypothetical protein
MAEFDSKSTIDENLVDGYTFHAYSIPSNSTSLATELVNARREQIDELT